MIKNGVSIYDKDRGRNGLFYYVVVGGNVEVVFYFFCSGLYVDCRLIWGKIVLYVVVVKGYVNVLIFFIFNGVYLEFFIGFGDIVLLFAVEEGYEICVKMFV